jgi:hypothetical protein
MSDAVATFIKNGFVKLPGHLFAPADFQKLSSYVLKTTDRLFPGKSGFCSQAWLAEPELIEFTCHSAVTSALIPFLGPNIGVFGAFIFKKKAQSPQVVPWHSDMSGYDMENEDIKGLSLTIAITESSESSGCVEFSPGSHLKRDWKHRFDLRPENSLFAQEHLEVVEEDLKKLAAPVRVELKPNEASLHDIACVHRSFPNNSDTDRIILVLRYFSTSNTNIKPEAKKFWEGNQYTFLVAGKDEAGICKHKLVP